MSVYIKGMEMPKNCCQCPVNMEVCQRGYRYLLGHPELYDKRADDCPIISVPEHGRLIDADAFIKQKTEQICENCNMRRGMKDGKLTKRFVYAIGDAPCRACDTGDMLDYVDDAPTIIPADKEGEG